MSFSRPATSGLRRMTRSSRVNHSLIRSTPSLSSFSLRHSISSSSSFLSSSSPSSSSHRCFFSSSKTTQEQQTPEPTSSTSSTSSSTPSSSAEPSTASPSTPSDSTSTSTTSSSTPPPPPSSPDAALTQQLAALEAKYKDTYDRLLRTAAEMENVRRTSRVDVDNARKYAATGFAKSMLEVADTLELAARSAKEQLAKEGGGEGSAVVKSLLEGIEMTDKVLLKALSDHGVVKVDAMGQKFNPHEHHGLFEVDDEGKEAGTVAHVMKAGYKINDRILRAAQVGTVRAKK